MKTWVNDMMQDGMGQHARRLVTQAFMANDRLRHDHASESRSLFSNGTRPGAGQSYAATIWSLVSILPPTLPIETRESRLLALRDIGYRHLRSRVVSYGSSFTEPSSSHFYDIIVVALTGQFLLTSPKSPPRLVEKWSYAIIPAGTQHGFECVGDGSVDVLTIEVGVGTIDMSAFAEHFVHFGAADVHSFKDDDSPDRMDA
mmetsp:Transcript_5668/g.14618  ORF Transcript_5668/g.14618 Transcript_5668/m.14618 type:complete len:201 (+) Transcript_5668:1343-1945(+)